MPRWLFTNEDIELAYTQAYMLHELAHIYHWLSRGVTTDIHGPEFREFETKLLGYYLDLRPLYNRKHGYAMAFISLQYHVLKFDSCGRSPHSALFELDA
jgi:predicted SprT family Zn-dependent metalloprotease